MQEKVLGWGSLSSTESIQPFLKHLLTLQIEKTIPKEIYYCTGRAFCNPCCVGRGREKGRSWRKDWSFNTLCLWSWPVGHIKPEPGFLYSLPPWGSISKGFGDNVSSSHLDLRAAMTCQWASLPAQQMAPQGSLVFSCWAGLDSLLLQRRFVLEKAKWFSRLPSFLAKGSKADCIIFWRGCMSREGGHQVKKVALK